VHSIQGCSRPSHERDGRERCANPFTAHDHKSSEETQTLIKALGSSMAKRHEFRQPLFRFLDLDVADIIRMPTAIQDMISRRLDGMIIRGVFSPQTAATVAARLERGEHSMNMMKFPAFEGLAVAPHLLGNSIVSCAAKFDEYFAAASHFRDQCRKLFGGEPDFESRVEEVLSALTGGRPVRIPAAPDGRTYTPATIRVLPEGHEIGIHVGNQFLTLPQSRHLASILDTTDQVSYFIPLTVPEAGGELIVYSLEWDDVSQFVPANDDPTPATYGSGSAEFAYFERFESMAFSPGVGDMLIFDGGRYYHRVANVVGPRARRTIGGFIGFSKEHDVLHYWS